jgi:two-component system sensor histidine kinase PhoQ
MVVAQPVLPAVERMLVAMGKVYADKRIETEVKVDPSIRFRGDEGDLMELLGNVLDNAFKWANGRIRITASLRDSRLNLTVEDDGPGIPEADAQRVLQRGARADESVPGHGIGLAVTRDIVEAYGGHILIARSDLGGAAVTLELPALA